MHSILKKKRLKCSFYTAKVPGEMISASGDRRRISQPEHNRSVKLLKPGQHHTKEGRGPYSSL